MHDWNFPPDHPISLPISADARLSPTDYINDQIWELCLGNTEPPAISLQTTFGLRARFCRIFPRFIYDNQVVNNPADFHQQITIHQYYPNYIRLSFRPFSCINVVLEYWVPDSHSIACRSRIVNISHETCQIQIEWAALLVPAPDGNRMSIKEIGLTTILAGETANLTPVLFVAGGAQAGKSPYPALNLSYSLPPNADQETRLAHSTMTEMNTSFEVAKDVLSKNWDTEFARIIRKNSQQLEITTGNPDWNMALYLTQTLADQLILQPTPLCNSSS